MFVLGAFSPSLVSSTDWSLVCFGGKEHKEQNWLNGQLSVTTLGLQLQRRFFRGVMFQIRQFPLATVQDSFLRLISSQSIQWTCSLEILYKFSLKLREKFCKNFKWLQPVLYLKRYKLPEWILKRFNRNCQFFIWRHSRVFIKMTVQYR